MTKTLIIIMKKIFKHKIIILPKQNKLNNRAKKLFKLIKLNFKVFLNKKIKII